jgi:uncharacterized protein
MSMRATILISAAALGLAACGSTPTYYYTLLPPPVTAAPAPGFQIEVLPVDLPSQVSTPQLVVRTGGGEMVPVDTRRWIAPLGDEIRGALSADLGQRLGAHDVYGLPAGGTPSAAPVYRINVKVQRFESSLGAYARIDALWTVRRAGAGDAALTCAASLSQPVQPGYEAMVEGHQQALGALADRVAASIAALRGNAPACPPG